MALIVDEVEKLKNYFAAVMDRAYHHADNVNEIALGLMGAILWRKDDEKPIRVMARDDEAKNVLWVYLGGRKYAFSYNYDTCQIEMRQNSTHGKVVKAFNNATSLAELYAFFDKMQCA